MLIIIMVLLINNTKPTKRVENRTGNWFETKEVVVRQFSLMTNITEVKTLRKRDKE